MPAPEARDIRAPAPLRDLPFWLCWRYEPHPEGGKPTKVPYYANGGKRYGTNGSPMDRAKMVKFATARDAAAKRGMDGVGLALMPEAGIVALDFDHCVDANGNVPPEIEQIAARTYTEYSPSGAGVRAFSVGNYGNRKAPATAEAYGFETFSSSGFVTFTGNILPVCELLGEGDTVADDPTVNAIIQHLCDTRFEARRAPEIEDDFMAGNEPRLGLSQPVMERILSHISPDISRDEWIRVGMALHHECEGDDTGFDLWNTWSSDGATYPGTEGLRTQWDSFDRRAGRGHKQVRMASVIDMAKKDGYVHTRAKSVVQTPLAPFEPDLSNDATDSSQTNGGVMTPEGYTGKFRIYHVSEPDLHKPLEWFIKGVLPKSDLIVLYGASGSGKSFVAFDMAAAVARGIAWQGCRVKRAKVVFVVAEGAGGMRNRVDAYCQHHGLKPADLDIGLVLAAPNVLDNDDVSELGKSIKLSGADIFVVDTFAQVTPGANENSGEEMGPALRNLRTITEATGATAWVVHHAGKDATRGARGWSGIKAAADAEIEISVSDSVRLIALTKLKDGDDSKRWSFRLATVTLGTDSDGDPISSCV